MGRGLSTQQRAVLAFAHDRHLRRDELARERDDDLARLETAGFRGAPGAHSRPAADFRYDEAMLALHGWCHGRGARHPYDARRRLGDDSIGVSSRHMWRWDAPEQTIDQAAYRAAHAALARTLARLVARGYLARVRRADYALTEAGIALATTWLEETEAA